MSVVERIPRSDKKKEIKASLPRPLRSAMEERAKEVGMSSMAYAAKLTDAGLHTEMVIRALAPYFRRGYVPLYARDSVIMMGRVIAPSLDALLPDGGDVTRFPVKLPVPDYLHVGEVAYSLCCSLAQALTIIISECIIQNVRVDSTTLVKR